MEKQSLDSYPASGGKRMLLSGHNFLPESKVMFVEKAQGKPKLVFSHSAFLISLPFASSLALVFLLPSPLLASLLLLLRSVLPSK